MHALFSYPRICLVIWMVPWHPVVVPLSAALVKAIDAADAVLDLVFAFEELDAEALGGVPGDVAMLNWLATE
jgi:hypothetical protein